MHKWKQELLKREISINSQIHRTGYGVFLHQKENYIYRLLSL